MILIKILRELIFYNNNMSVNSAVQLMDRHSFHETFATIVSSDCHPIPASRVSTILASTNQRAVFL